jgi:HSP20 family molecular chaperone IbpA
MLEIDEAIGQVENLYRAVTGKQFPESDAPYAPIPEGADPATHVRFEVERLLAALAMEQRGMDPQHVRAWMPPISVVETPAEVFVSVDVPGVSRDRLAVSVQQGVLVVEGQRAIQPPACDRFFVEPPSGPFRRTVPLPPGLKLGEMNAQLKDGVLEIRIPRGEVSARKINVS